MSKRAIRNLLVAAGAFYLAMLLQVAAVLAFGPITQRLVFTGDFQAVVVMPIVLGIPSALVMGMAGAATAWFVESKHPIIWAVLPSIGFGLSAVLGPYWSRAPRTMGDHAYIALGALFPAAACVAAAAVVTARLRHTNACQG
jgi:hypothetical protein